MIHHIQGNLLESDCQVIGHQCNCKLAFGSGIAGQIKNKFPYASRAFFSDVRDPKDKLGTFTVGISPHQPIIFNLYGQFNYGPGDKRYTNYEKLEQALDLMMKEVIDIEATSVVKLKVGVPYKIGCGLAGGDWTCVRMIIEKLSEKYNHDIYVYEFNP